MAASMNVNKDDNNSLTNLLLSSSQPNTSIVNSSEINTDTPSRPIRSKKRLNPESPDELPGTARQVTRQIRRRNSLGDLSSTTSKKTSGLRKTIADKVVEALTSPEVLDQIIPVISDKLCESIGNSLSKTVEAQVKSALDEHIKPLKETIQKQQETITEQKSVIKKQAELVIATNKRVTSNEQTLNEYNTEIGDLYQRINLLEIRLENQEQYSRRTSLRFHNIQVPIDRSGRIIHPVNTDDLILNVCNQKLKLGIQKEDIGRSHVIGKVRNGKSQVIVRFLSYRIREKVYSAKKRLKGDPDKIFITENLTTFRTNLVKELSDLKFNHNINAYWTNDGRIYAKKSESSTKQLIRNHDDILDLLRNIDFVEPISDMGRVRVQNNLSANSQE